MHRNTQKNDYTNYSYLSPSTSTSSPNTHYQYYDPRLRIQHQYQPSTNISDLTESISIFHDLKLPIHRRSNVTPFPSAYIPPNPSRRSSVHDTHLATASAMRERLLTNIQRNISEIDQELSSLEQRPSITHYIPPRFSSLEGVQRTPIDKKTHLSNDQNQIWPNKPKRIYEVIPRRTSETKKTSQHSTPQQTDQSISHSYIGQYHYGPEIEEIEIHENDPENCDLKSTINEISELNFHKTYSLDQFLREQSALPQNRALISVPQYGDNNKNRYNESTENFYQNNPNDTNIARSLTVSSLHDLTSTDKLNIQDFELLIQTASEPNTQISPENVLNPDESSNKIKPDLINTMLSKPVKHSHSSTITTQETLSSSQQAITNPEKNIAVDSDYFFSDFGNEGEGEEDLISIDPSNFSLPTELEMISNDNISNTLIKQSSTSLLNLHSSQKQQKQLTIQNNNEHVKETESKKMDATTKHLVTTTSTSPSKKMLPVSIYDTMQTQLARNNSNINKDQRRIPTKVLHRNTFEQSSENKLNNLSIYLQSSSPTSERKTTNKTPSKDMNSMDQRSISVNKQSHSSRQRSVSLRRSFQNQSSNILSRHQSVVSIPHIPKTPAKQTEQHVLDTKKQTPVESGRSSALPIPLNSPDFNNIQPSTSRATTPERRNSISLLDQNTLLKSTDIINFDNPSTDNLQTASYQQPNTECQASSPLINFISLQEIQYNNQSDEFKLELSSNQDQDEFICQSSSLFSSIHEQENDRLKSISPFINETKKSEYDDLHLPSISRHSDISDANLGNEDQFKHEKKPTFPPPPIKEEWPPITASQRRSKLSLIVRPPKSKRKKPVNDQPAQTHTEDFSSINNDEKPKQHRHVLFSNSVTHFQIEENHPLENWRERINTILTKKHIPNDKYSHIKSRVNSFDNFEYQPKRIMILPIKKSHTKVSSNHQINAKKNNLKKNKTQSKQQIPLVKKPRPHLSGRLWHLPDGSPKIFHESLNWNVQSKIKSYSFENLQHRNDLKIFKWHSESKLTELIKDNSHYQSVSLPTILDDNESHLHHQESTNEIKIFDINPNSQQSLSNFQESFLVDVSSDSKQSNKPIFNEKLVWTKKSKLKDSIWKNINYQPKKSTVQIFHQPVHWNNKSKIRKKYWSEIDLHQLTKKKSLLTQYYDSEWNDIFTNSIDIIDDNSLKQDYIEKNFNDKLYDQTLQKKTPPNRPKWNSVSKTRSVNTVYNPKVLNSNLIRRGWDLELRRKRIHKLPPLKRKRKHDEIPQLAIKPPPSNDQLAIEYNYNHSSLTNDHLTSIDYTTISSRRSSKALVPLRRFSDLQLLSETPRSQRPVQQEWYDELNKSRLTHRTDIERTRNNSFRDSIGSIQHTNTPRELLTLRSSTRNSQNSVMSSTLLDSSIRSNRATELRLSKDMDEHHQHSHDPSQSMPIEIRGFRLEGTQLTVPDNAKIRPLSNVNYRASERVKTRRIYPWNHLNPQGTSSRNSLLVPIAEFRHPSFETSIGEVPQLIYEEP